MDPTLPPSRPVTLRDVTRREYPSRVEYVEDGLAALAWPTGFPATEEFGVGYHVEVLWTEASGVQVQPMAVVEVRTEGNVRLWLARPTGARRREQRRAYVRVPMGAPLVLTHGEPEQHLKAMLVDVSEAGARARVRSPSPVTADGRVHLGFSVSGTGFAVEATVLRVEHSADQEGHDELVLLFDIPERTAGDLRRAVFAEQIRQRNLMPES